MSFLVAHTALSWSEDLYLGDHVKLARHIVRSMTDPSDITRTVCTQCDAALGRELADKLDFIELSALLCDFGRDCTDKTLDYVKWIHELDVLLDEEYSMAFGEACIYKEVETVRWFWANVSRSVLFCNLEEDDVDLAWINVVTQT